MIALLAAAVAAPPVEEALAAELARSVGGLRLSDAPAPYFIAYDVLDGKVATAFGEFGALVQDDVAPYRHLRTEVRVGGYAADSSNFSAFGEPDGVVGRGLPVEDDVLALRREAWLSTDEAYKQAIEQFSRKAAARRGREAPEAADFSAEKANIQVLSAVPLPVDAARVREIAGALSAALDRPELELGQAVARDWQGARLLLSSEGTRAWRPTGYTVVRVEGTLRTGDGSELRDARWWVGRDFSRLPSLDKMLAETREMADWLVGLAAAPKEDEYLGPVIFEDHAAVELFSQLLAAELVGSPPMEQDEEGFFSRSRSASARLGRRLLPAGWSVVDDAGRAPLAAGSYPWDHEGVPPRRVDLVLDGVLRDVLMSRMPTKHRAVSTGHGRSLGEERRAALPAVVTVAPKRLVTRRKLERTALRLAAQTGRSYALVVRRLEPPAMTEDFHVTFSGQGPPPGLTPPYEAYRLYADGRREPVRSVGFRGVDRRVLRDIVAAAPGAGPVDTLDGPPGPERFHIGPTGGVPMTWDTPSVLIAEMELEASGAGEPRVLASPRR